MSYLAYAGMCRFILLGIPSLCFERVAILKGKLLGDSRISADRWCYDFTGKRGSEPGSVE